MRFRPCAPVLSLAFVLAASLGACAAPPEPAKVATVATDPPLAAGSATPASSAAPAATASPAQDPSAAGAASASPRKRPPGDAVAHADPKDDLAKLETQILSVLNAQGNVTTGLLSNGAAVPGGAVGGVAGLSLGGGNTGAGGIGGVGAPVGGASTGPQTVSGPTAAVAIGNIQVSGGAVANASRVVAGMAAGFRRCVNRALAADPTAVKKGAKLVVTAVLDSTGAVASAMQSGVSGLPGTATSCIAARVASAQFAPPDTGTAKIEIQVAVQVTPP